MLSSLANSRTKVRKSASASSKIESKISHTTIAPALMSGLRGIPLSASNWTRELNEVPDGSTSTRFHNWSPMIL